MQNGVQQTLRLMNPKTTFIQPDPSNFFVMVEKLTSAPKDASAQSSLTTTNPTTINTHHRNGSQKTHIQTPWVQACHQKAQTPHRQQPHHPGTPSTTILKNKHCMAKLHKAAIGVVSYDMGFSLSLSLTHVTLTLFLTDIWI